MKGKTWPGVCWLAAFFIFCLVNTATAWATAAAAPGWDGHTGLDSNPGVVSWEKSRLAAAREWPLLDEVRSLVEQNYTGAVEPGLWEEGAARGLVESLGDPYSEYIAPDDMPAFAASLDDEYVGVGIVLQDIDGRAVITSIIPGSPAARQGLKSGAVLVEVDGRAVEGRPLEEIGQMLEGKPGTNLGLTVTLPGSDNHKSYSLRRELIRPPVVSSRLLPGRLGYLYLRAFPYWAPAEVEQALTELQRQGARGLVLDLRGNPGGYLDAALEVASLFLLRDKPVVQVVGRDKRVTLLRSRGPGQDLPLIVLVDRGTASAAEILAGALQADKAALLLGTQTFGKGAVQTVFSLSNGGALKITTAHYLTPAGEAIDGKGLKPDIEVPEGQEQLERALTILQGQTTRPRVARTGAAKPAPAGSVGVWPAVAVAGFDGTRVDRLYHYAFCRR
ncbi:MAG: carboxyl-terminal processing protease [Clostridia bacterium]|nr:carboxyl-terminal processing protease [Clostridia bacterium]